MAVGLDKCHQETLQPHIVHSFVSWLKAIGSKWVAEVTGGALIGLLYLYSSVRGVTVAPIAYEIAIAFAIIQAAFLTWRDENNKVKELTPLRIPDLNGEIAWDILEPVNDWPSLHIRVRIVNLGAPSIVDSWILTLHLKFKNGTRQSIRFSQFLFDDVQAKGSKRLEAGDALNGSIILRLDQGDLEFLSTDDVESIDLRYCDFLKKSYLVSSNHADSQV